MANECHHIMPSGARCRAYALRGTNVCYFHTNMNRVEKARVQCRALPFAPIEDLRGIQLALIQVFNMIDNPYSDNRRVGQFLYALQIATSLASRIESQQLRNSSCPHCDNANQNPEEPLVLEPTGVTELLPTEITPVPASPILESTEVSGTNQLLPHTDSISALAPSNAFHPHRVTGHLPIPASHALHFSSSIPINGDTR